MKDYPVITPDDIRAFETRNQLSFEHIGRIAPTFTDFLKVGHPADPS